MANDKDFILKNALEVGGIIKGTLGTITSSDLDLSTGDYFTDTLAANTTYTFSNAGDIQTFYLEVVGASTYEITWPTTVEWANGITPDAPSAGDTNFFIFSTDDSGTTYHGFKLLETLS